MRFPALAALWRFKVATIQRVEWSWLLAVALGGHFTRVETLARTEELGVPRFGTIVPDLQIYLLSLR